jgi:hypothetical protein
MPDRIDFFSFGAVIVPLWIFLGYGLSVPGFKSMSRRYVVGWTIAAFIVACVAWYSGAQQSAEQRRIIEGINQIVAGLPQVQPLRNLDQASIERLTKELARLEPRHLSKDQISELDKSAKAQCPIAPRVGVTAANSNQEAQVYALEFVKVLKGAGCSSDMDLPIPGLTPDVQGIYIGVHDMKNIPDSATKLGRVLSSANIAFHFAPLTPDFFASSEFVLIIGARPSS